MASAFTLFGEILVKTDDLDKGLEKAERSLKDTRREMEKTEDAAEDLGGGVQDVSTDFAALASKATVVAAAIGAVAVAVVKAHQELWNLAHAAAESTGKISDLSKQTGVSAETLSALKFAAESSGKSFDIISSSLSKFTDLVGDAQTGSKKAIAVLNEFGLTPVQAANDLEGAFKQVVERISSYATPTDRAKAATDAFGSAGRGLALVMDDAGGSIERVTENARNANAVIGSDGVAAADAYNRAYNKMSAETAALTNQIGSAFLPAFTMMVSQINSGLASNTTAWSRWSTAASTYMNAVITTAKTTGSLLSAIFSGQSMGAVVAASSIGIGALGDKVAGQGPSGLGGFLDRVRRMGGLGARRYGGDGGGGGGGGGRGGGGGTSNALQEIKAYWDARIALERTRFESSIAEARRLLKQRKIVEDDFWQSVIRDTRKYGATMNMLLEEQFKVDAKGLSGKALETLELKLEAARIRLGEFTVGVIESAQALRESHKDWGMTIEQAEKLLTVTKALTIANEQLNDTFIARGSGSMGDGFGVPITEQGTDPGIPPMLPPISQWQQFFEILKKGFADFKATLPSIKEALTGSLINTIYGIGDVFANAVQNWDGTAKGFFKNLAQGFRQMVQQILAELVRLMIIKAIMNIIGAAAGGASGGHASGGLGGGGGVGGAGGSPGFAMNSFAGNGFAMAGATNNFSNSFAVTINNPQNPKEVQRGMGQMVGQSLRALQRQQERFGK